MRTPIVGWIFLLAVISYVGCAAGGIRQAPDARYSEVTVQISVYDWAVFSTRSMSVEDVREERVAFLELRGFNDVLRIVDLIGVDSETLKISNASLMSDGPQTKIVFDFVDLDGVPQRSFVSDGCVIYDPKRSEGRGLSFDAKSWLGQVMLRAPPCGD